MADIDIKIKDNTGEILNALDAQSLLGLKAIGAEMEGYAKSDCPVDTGRLRNSITWAVKGEQSPPNTNKTAKGQTDAKPSDYKTKATPEKNVVYIGTNVEYAVNIEYNDMKHKTGKAHFLRDAGFNHKDHYKSILEAALKAGS